MKIDLQITQKCKEMHKRKSADDGYLVAQSEGSNGKKPKFNFLMV